MLLPAAFHFTLSYRPGEDAQTTLAEQKKDILQMSRGVSVVLICSKFLQPPKPCLFQLNTTFSLYWLHRIPVLVTFASFQGCRGT